MARNNLSFEEQAQLQGNLFHFQDFQNAAQRELQAHTVNINSINSNNIANNKNTSMENMTKTTADATVQLATIKALQSGANVATSGLFGLGGIAAGLGTSLISGGFNYLYAKNLIQTQAEAQRSNFDYMTGKSEQAFTSAGLPSWLAFTGGRGASAFPTQSQGMGGQNFFTSALPGNTSNLAWTGSQSQLALGVGDMPSTSS